MMNLAKCALCLALIFLGGAVKAQESEEGAMVPDPTQPGPNINETLKSPLSSLQIVTLGGLVVAGGGDGIALLRVQGRDPLLVHSNSQFTATAGGAPLSLVVKRVSAAGVELEAPSLKGTWLVASSTQPATGVSSNGSMIQHVEFRDVPLRDALQMLTDQSGTNYSASTQAGKLPVSLFLQHVTGQTVAEEICKTHNLWFRRDDATGITRVMTLEEFERDLVSYREDQTETFTLLYPNVVEVALAVRNLFGDRVQLSMNTAEMSDDARDLSERLQRFDLINSRSQGIGSGTGSGSGGGGSTYATGSGAAYFDGNQSVALTPTGNGVAASEFRAPTPDRAQQLQSMLNTSAATNGGNPALEAFRRQPPSIYITLSRRNNMIIVRSGDRHALDEIRELIHRMDRPTAMVLLEVKILSLDLGDDFNSIFDYQFSGVAKNWGGKNGLTAGGFSQGSIQAPAAGSVNIPGTGLNAGAMTFQYINDIFRLRMQLLEETKRVTVLATPILLTANNEVSRLFLGEERPIVRSITSQTIMTENNVATTPNTTFEFRPVGTALLITPNINADRTVTLRLMQENSSINEAGASIPVVTSSGMVQNVSVDVVASRTISGTFVVKDGLAAAIGGLIEEQKLDQREQIPWFGRIPVLGFFFRNQTTKKARKELVIMIRPHVISTPADSERISQDLLKELMIHPAVPEAKGTLDTFKRSDLDQPVKR